MHAAEQLERLKKALAAITDATSKIEALRTRLEDLSARYKAAHDAVGNSPHGPSTPVPLRAALRDCRQKGADCDEAYEDCSTSLTKLAGLRDAAPQHEGEIRAAVAELEASGLAKALPLEPFTPAEEFATLYVDALRLVGVRLGRVSESLNDLDKALGELAEAQRAHAEQTAREKKDTEEKESAFARLKAVVAKIAEASGLPGATARPLDSASALSMGLEIACFDRVAVVAEGEQEATPSDEVLQRIPDLVTSVFDHCPEVSRVRIRIDAEGLSDTGLTIQRTIQTFSTEQPRWRELMAGKYRADWQALLSKSKPAPMYPRTSAPRLDAPWIVVAISAICILGLAVIYVARMRMLQRL